MQKTRFPELLLDQVAPGDWRFACAEMRRHVGARYRSKAEALADLERYYYAAWAGAAARPRPHLDATAAAQMAVYAHTEAAGLESENGAAVDLWHLLASLLEWCDAWEIDFDATLSSVRADIAAGLIGAASRAEV